MKRFALTGLACGCIAVASLLSIASPVVLAQEGSPAQETETSETETLKTKPTDASPASDSNREERLAKYLSGATFTGHFTVDGREDKMLKPESYTIRSCEKLDAPDMYSMKVAIKYGDTDGEFPMQLKILWSDRTPVITMDSVWIPGLGTFSSRVLIHDGRYAGTWQHDAKGGHLFGKITPAE
ncbi:hypothetical protein LOC71_13300 [Rhodopirellula sp. JC740]|uniref:Uncharacterized protein n=1 Tax=Rhodopirellula halodulae TaxID=2894198 RepID=A0ABS8NI71_9BACT|nr:hypothetical protein [Rhodopirellula sp. JC740]MCC9643255.1 hypothetical protein [Rhodopirellula sp. JC740]